MKKKDDHPIWSRKRREREEKKREREKKSDHKGKRVYDRALSTKKHRVFFKRVNIFYFQFDPILILKGQTMTK